MSKFLFAALLAAITVAPAAAQQPAPAPQPPAAQQPAPAPQPPAAQQPAPAPAPTFATTKVQGTENVYIFRYQNHQAMFIVTPAGVIATDPISLKRPAAKAYVEEIQKITKAPIRYLVYSHYHYDHIAGGKPFKDAGATVIAHRNTTRRLAALKDPDVVIPTQSVDGKRVIKLGGTTLELHYVGRNHSDGSLVMLLPKEKIIFTVDFIPIGSVPSRLGVGDSYPGEWEQSLKRVLAMNWERMIPGHPGPGGRLGTKKDLEQMIGYFTDLSAAVKKAADAGQCFDTAEKEVRLPQYATLQNYEQNIAINVHRYCWHWGRGY